MFQYVLSWLQFYFYLESDSYLMSRVGILVFMDSNNNGTHTVIFPRSQ